jgi:rSAM/selenodomain-associated transferase 2
VVPVLNEQENLRRLLREVTGLGLPYEVIVADGGSSDATTRVASELGAHVVSSARGRGSQLRAGIAHARGRWLMVLHADVSLDDAALAAARRFLEANQLERFAVWPLQLDGTGAWLRVLERGAALRGRVLGLPYGDQGLVVARGLYERVGGYADIPIMEDVALVRALARCGTLTWLGAPLRASARRYEREGRVRRTLLNLGLVTLFAAGVAPQRLARWYRAEPPSP